jgi:hypothetical protein
MLIRKCALINDTWKKIIVGKLQINLLLISLFNQGFNFVGIEKTVKI